ncbi:unnamed protein product [Paramecium pentaurelia]|uniref:Uncharacterized protein n=1 Tax=Paramecium pentaurelia TaxID=43138 RepID=A0A8S1TKA2_9CILI|nr:unnamed protein product [Paramecium pentaurelia]
MKINQYACISLTQDYQKKGDIPDCKDQWIILNKAQCIKHKLQEYEPIVGPGKLDSQNTDNQFTTQTPNSSSIFTIINDKLLIAFKQKILQYDRISDLFSTDKYSTCLPQQIHTVTQGNVISMHPNQNNCQLIVRTENAIILYKFSNSNLSLQKTYNYSNVKQLNIQNNVLFLCLPDKLIAINLINQTEQILKVDNKIVAGYLKDSEYYYICDNSNVVKSLQKNYELTIPIPIVINALFLINKFICICGYETKYEPYDDEDEEPATYSSHIFWYDMTCNQPIKDNSHIEIDLIQDTNNKGDFGITQLSDLYIVYGSNLRIATFWTLDRLCQQAKRYENSDEKLELLQHSEIRGLVTYKSNNFIGFGMNQKNFSCIERNPNICILDKKGGLLMYEFFNFKKIVEYQNNQPQPQNSIFQNNQNLFKNTQLISNRSQRQQKSFDDIKFTLIESEKKEMNIIANPPFNLQLMTQNKNAQMVFGQGKINYEFRLYQNENPSANLVIDYQHFQIIGHEREIIILTPIIIQQILSQQQQSKLQIQKITSNPGEIINSLCLFQNKILIQTNTCLYLVNYQDEQWNIQLLLNHNHIKRVQVLDQYLLLTICQVGMQQILYEYKKDSLQQKVTHISDAACLLQLDGQTQLLLIIDDQLYVLKDFETKQLVQIDIQIKQSKQYFITQLHENHIYLSFATIDEYEFNHYILNYDVERNQAKQEQHLNDILSNLNINDHTTQITNFDWNITSINTPKAKIIIIFPNGIQEGYIFQVCGNDLRTIDNEKGEPIQLSSYTHYVKGISNLKYVLPSEEKLGEKPGLCTAKQDQKEFQYQMQPSLLIYEYDERSSLTIHRQLLIKLDQLNDSTPLLQVVQDEPPKQQQKPSNPDQQKTFEKLQNEAQKQINKQQPQPPKRITQITYQLQEFCKQSIKQLNGEEEDDLLMKPYFAIFTSQKSLDQLSAHYTQIQNARQIIKSKTKESSSVQDFCLLRKSFDIPKFKFSYDDIQQTLSQLSKVEEQFSWICNFVINTLQMNPIKRNKITFGEFEFPSIHHITPKKQSSISKTKFGRKIVFTEFSDQEPKADFQMAYIEKLCQARKSNVKYLKLSTETNKEIYDPQIPLNVMSTTSFGISASRLSKQHPLSNLDEKQNDNKTLQSNFQAQVETRRKMDPIQTQIIEKKSEINSSQQSSDLNSKVLTRTKGGLLGLESDLESLNPFKSDKQSIGEINMIESQNIDTSKQKDNPQETTKPLFGFGQLNLNNNGLLGDLKLDVKPNSLFQNTNLQKQTLNENDKTNQDKSVIKTENGIIQQQNKKPQESIFAQPITLQPQNQIVMVNSNQSEKQQKANESSFINTNFGEGKSIFSSLTPNVESSSTFLGIKTNIQDNTQDEQNKKKEAGNSLLQNQQKESQAHQQKQQKSENQEESQIPKINIQPPAQTSAQGPAQVTAQTSSQTSAQTLSQTSSQAQTSAQVQAQTSAQGPAQVTAQTSASTQSIFTFAQKSDTQAAPIQQQPSNQAQAPLLQLGSSMFTQGQQDVNFNTYLQSQPTSILQNSGNQTFQGMQNTLGLQQQSSSGIFNINTSSFGSTSSIFDQKSTAPPPQQKISFTNLANQNMSISTGGIFGQPASVNQGGFIQTTAMNLGFDPNQEKPRK